LKVILTIPDNGLQKAAIIYIDQAVHICPGMNLILTCSQRKVRVPIKEVDIKADDGSQIARIDPNFASKTELLEAPELEWFTTPS
jgi:hypothetical protein